MGYREILNDLSNRMSVARSLDVEDISVGDLLQISYLDIVSDSFVDLQFTYEVVYVDNKPNVIPRPGLQKPPGMYLRIMEGEDEEVNFREFNTKFFSSLSYGHLWIARTKR